MSFRTTILPEVTMFRRLPSYGLYARHIKGLRLHNLHVELETQDARPALYAEDVARLDLEGFVYDTPGNKQPAIRLHDTTSTFLRGSRASAGSAVFLALEGSRTSCVTVIGNDFSQAVRSLDLASEIASGSFFSSANRPARDDH